MRRSRAAFAALEDRLRAAGYWLYDDRTPRNGAPGAGQASRSLRDGAVIVRAARARRGESGIVAKAQLPAVFPYEGFVLPAVQRHFERLGFRVETSGEEDLTCVQRETGERWCIEAKGETSSRPTDFQTGLGQLLQRMLDPAQHYALALPDTPPFRRLCHSISPWARTALRLHWLLVADDGQVQLYPPEQQPELP